MQIESGIIRKSLEQMEVDTLSEYACKSVHSKGRAIYQEPCPVRTIFQQDRDRILHSKAFRRLKHKTQVFLAPSDDHYRTRMTHTLEVAQISRTIAKALRLNEDLTEAIALGHDLGHTPFGHIGESVLNEILPQGFKHNQQSVRIVTHIENLNITTETLDGILNHTGAGIPTTLEGQIVKVCDRLAYIRHDIDDSVRANIISLNEIPEDCYKYFNFDKNQLLPIIVYSIIKNSYEQPAIKMDEECLLYMNKLRSWMFDNVYLTESARNQEAKSKRVLKELFDYYMELMAPYLKTTKEIDIQTTIADYIAGMTDIYAIKKYTSKFVPKAMQLQEQDDFLFKLAKINGVLS